MQEFLSSLLNHKDRFSLWRQFINDANFREIAEVGVWKGTFSAEVLRACPSIERYHMIDPWASLPDWDKPLNVSQQQFDEVFQEAMQVTEFAEPRRVVHRGRTKDVAAEIDDGALDYAYIDGDHTLRGITLDLQLMLGKIKPGGYLGGDDFCKFAQHFPDYEPSLVCPYAVYFAEANGLPFWVLPHNQFLIHNAPAEGFSYTDTTSEYGDLSLTTMFARQTDGVLSKAKKAIGKILPTG